MKDRYRSRPPYVTVYEWADGHVEMWNCPTLREALVAFWQDEHLSRPAFRSVSDSRGRVVLSEEDRKPTVYTFSATAEAWKLMVDTCEDQHIARKRLKALEAMNGR